MKFTCKGFLCLGIILLLYTVLFVCFFCFFFLWLCQWWGERGFYANWRITWKFKLPFTTLTVKRILHLLFSKDFNQPWISSVQKPVEFFFVWGLFPYLYGLLLFCFTSLVSCFIPIKANVHTCKSYFNLHDITSTLTVINLTQALLGRADLQIFLSVKFPKQQGGK